MKIRKAMKLTWMLKLMLACTSVYGEEATDSGVMDPIAISGLIEVEFGYESTSEEDAGDLVLATVELGIDVDITEHVTGHILLLNEEDDTEPMDVDEGYITLDGGDAMPLFLRVGKMYLPFGRFESHFVSDPLFPKAWRCPSQAPSSGFRVSCRSLRHSSAPAVFAGTVQMMQKARSVIIPPIQKMFRRPVSRE